MKSFRCMSRVGIVIPLFGLLTSLAACSGQASTDGTASTNNAVANAAQTDKGEAYRGFMHGPGSLVFAALHENIDLTDAQRATIQAAADSIKPKKGEFKPSAEMKAHHAALAAAVRAGKIDTTTLTAPKIEIDHSAQDANLVKALTTLHDTLNKDQRAALVAAVQKKAADHKPGKEMKEGHHGHHGPMGFLKDLDLTQDQKDQIKAKLEADKPQVDHEAMKAQHEAFKKDMDARLASFVSDQFDAKAFIAPPANAPKMNGDHFAKMLSVVVPILTPDQREKLAQKLEKGPEFHHEGPPKGE
jgi:Spy/CpxP family protein refolding chaperone